MPTQIYMKSTCYVALVAADTDYTPNNPNIS
jgi:hypothetical protein